MSIAINPAAEEAVIQTHSHMKHYLNLKVRNHSGVMSHVSGLFARRGYNIDSIAVGETADARIASMTIVVHGDDKVVAQITNQVRKLPDVLEIRDLNYNESVTREFCLVTVAYSAANRLDIISVCDVFKARIVDMSETALMIEASGTGRQITAFIKMLSPFGIKDMARTGRIALPFESERVD